MVNYWREKRKSVMEKLAATFLVLILILLTVLTVSTTVTAATTNNGTNGSNGIQWVDYSTGMDKAQIEQKQVMIYFHTDWCSWCGKLEGDTFQDGRVVQQSRDYIAIKVDGDEQKDLVEQFDVQGYPTIVFLNTSGNEENRIFGYVPAESFLQAMGSSGSLTAGFVCPLSDSQWTIYPVFIIAIGIMGLLAVVDKRKKQKQ